MAKDSTIGTNQDTTPSTTPADVPAVGEHEIDMSPKKWDKLPEMDKKVAFEVLVEQQKEILEPCTQAKETSSTTGKTSTKFQDKIRSPSEPKKITSEDRNYVGGSLPQHKRLTTDDREDTGILLTKKDWYKNPQNKNGHSYTP